MDYICFVISVHQFRLPIFIFSYLLKCHNSCEMRIQVLFCSTENGRTSFVRQLEPDWHIDSNPEIVTQLAVYYHHSSFLDRCYNVLILIYLPILMHSFWILFLFVTEIHQIPTSHISYQTRTHRSERI
jgi:hypothetical protein